MSQQTINVGAAPNDGTGTPLRTAFQYTNSNFTELYTALGGGAGLPGATTQVIFNDGGTNLAGDAGLTYNKTTDTLSMGAATITGDLTVDTNTLKVDSANNRVGVGTASPSGIFHAANLGTAGTTADNFNGYFSSANRNCSIYLLAKNTEGSNFYFGDGDNNTIGGIIYDHTSNYMRFDANGSEQMRLNSTGLGVGDVPTADCKLTVRGGAFINRGATGGASQLLVSLAASSGGNFGQISNTGTRWALGYGSTLTTVGTEALIWDSSGNVGVGVTPSAWNWAGIKALELGYVGNGFLSWASSETYLLSNTYYNSGFKYGTAVGASYYRQLQGVHSWHTNSNSPSAGGSATFTQAMTLDASGNLLVGTTSTAGSASNNTKTIGGLFSTINGATGSTATGVAATLFTAPNEAVFIVSAYIVGSAAASNYNAVAIVKVSGGNAAITTISSASNLTISLSGLNVQATQTSGINQAFAYSAVRIS